MSVLVVDGVWKSYPRWRPGTRSVRSMLSPNLRNGRRSGDTRWALRDISFSVEPGEGLGVIGHNGAGKSTLLRLASGITRPTRGSLLVTPSTASVLSLGDTFNADLSGNANAVTAAVIGGLTPAQARTKLPQAIEFAELEDFQEAPVRSYSDGMKLRLAFGVMTLLEPDLLIVDEVLAVGDMAFQEKCMDHLNGLRNRGTAVVMASHDLGQIQEQCGQAMLLESGGIVAYGASEDVIDAYRERSLTRTLDVTPSADPEDANTELVLQTNRFGSQDVKITAVEVRVNGRPGAATGVPTEANTGANLDLDVELGPTTAALPVVVSVTIERAEDDVKCIDINTADDDLPITTNVDSSAVVGLTLGALELMPGLYWIDVGVFPPDWAHAYDYHHQVYPLRITGSTIDEVGPVFHPANRSWKLGSKLTSSPSQ